MRKFDEHQGVEGLEVYVQAFKKDKATTKLGR